MFKKAIAVLLAYSIAMGLIPTISFAEGGAQSTSGTDVFKGTATYLIQERFNGPHAIENGNDNIIVSGWDVDYRGGRVYKGSGKLILLDTDAFEKTSMNHKVMSHSGDGLVLETSLEHALFVKDGLYCEVGGADKSALMLLVKDQYLCIEKADGTYERLVKCELDTTYDIKAIFSNSEKEVSLWINGARKGDYAYNENTDVIDEIEIGTSKEQVGSIRVGYVYMYVNYIINENFIAAPLGTVPEWINTVGGSVCNAVGAPYWNDLKGFSIPENGNIDIDFPAAIPSDWDSVAYSWDMYLPEDSGEIVVNDDFVVSNGKFYFGNEEIYSYTKNTWYRLQVVDHGDSADVYVNNVKKATGNGIAVRTDFVIENNSDASIIVDNVTVSKAFDKSDFADYPSTPEVVKSDDYHVGMVIYPMWREGIHYGWDLLTPYEERKPYLGYYTGGSREAADWDNKWLLEHGVDHAIFPFVRPNADGAVNFSVRGEALHDGYLTSEYKDQLDFAVMITNPTDDKYDSGAEFIENVEPFIVEHYFKNPSYKSIDNRLVIYCYNFKGIAECLGDDTEGSTAADKDFTQIDMVLNSLNEAAKKIDNGEGGTYDGITFIADVSAGGTGNVDDYIATYEFGKHMLKWRYTWTSDKPGTIISGTKDYYDTCSNYVASIPMGFDRTPWTKSSVGLMSPDEVSQICEEIKAYKGEDDPNIALFTCWDEWGEGHFHAPSEYGGFGYLNAIRKNFTNAGEKTNQARPSDEALKRIDVLYPEGRQILKVMPDRKIYTADNVKDLTVYKSKDLYNVKGSPGGATRSSKTINGKSSYVYTITNGDQATVTLDMTSLNMDISDISAIKINGYAENSATMVVYMQTDKTAGTDNIYPTSLRFEGTNDGSKTAKDVILVPDNPDQLTGKLLRIRFNPTAKTAAGSEIFLNSITFYTGNLEIKTYVDDQEYIMVSAPVEKDDTVYIPAYRFLLDLKAYPLWNKATKTLTVEKEDVTLELKAGSKTVKVNGKDTTFKNAPYYENGNLWVPYDELLKEFGYTATYNGDKREIKYKSKNYDAIKNYVNNDNVWTFDIDGFSEGWASGNLLVAPKIKNGAMYIIPKTHDPILTISGLSVPKSKAKCAVIKIKNLGEANNGYFRLYDENINATGVVYQYNLEKSDEFQEFVINLETDALVNSSYKNTYEDLADTITKIRIDPINAMGNVVIDHIGIYEEKPGYKYDVNAYGYNPTNMFQLDSDKNSYVFTSMQSSSDGKPLTETVDGYENVLKLVPTSANGMFTLSYVWYKGTKVAVGTVSSHNRLVKVSFWYKGIGDTTSFRLENRSGGALDGEVVTVTDVSSSEWKYYEGYYDMSKVGNSGRWYSLRVYQSKAGGLYVRDYKYEYFDDDTPLKDVSEGDIKFGVKDHNGNKVTEGEVYLVEYNDEGALTNITTYDLSDSEFYYFDPSEIAKLKLFYWNELEPMSREKILK